MNRRIMNKIYFVLIVIGLGFCLWWFWFLPISIDILISMMCIICGYGSLCYFVGRGMEQNYLQKDKKRGKE